MKIQSGGNKNQTVKNTDIGNCVLSRPFTLNIHLLRTKVCNMLPFLYKDSVSNNGIKAVHIACELIINNSEYEKVCTPFE